MKKTIKFFYGMSGTFKTTLINTEVQNHSRYTSPYVVWSMIKQWKDLETSVFSGLVEKNHLNFALLHLCNLGNAIKSSENDGLSILVERGVSDPLFYYLQEDEMNYNNWIKTVIDKELDLCNGFNIEKTLLVQRDSDFIENVILKEPHRKAIFPSVENYLTAQEKYIEFTEKFNEITEKIEINNAESFLNSLGITFKF